VYKTSDPATSTRDWIALNFDAIPGGVFERLYGESPEELERVLPEPAECARCGGDGTVSGDEPGETDECQICDGTGEAPAGEDDERELYGWPAAHSTLWTCEDRPEHREALLASGFIVYTDESREGTFANGDQIARVAVRLKNGRYRFEFEP
jgi:hypothetical protein